MNKNIEWVVTLVTEDNTVVRGVQKAMFGHPAIDFFSKRMGIKAKAATAEKMVHFEQFLAQGHRKPLTQEELA
jgi:hypothetical protein